MLYVVVSSGICVPIIIVVSDVTYAVVVPVYGVSFGGDDVAPVIFSGCFVAGVVPFHGSCGYAVVVTPVVQSVVHGVVESRVTADTLAAVPAAVAAASRTEICFVNFFIILSSSYFSIIQQIHKEPYYFSASAQVL